MTVTDRAAATSTTKIAEWRGPVLEVLREMLGEYEHSRQVLAIFEQLVARNSELELQLSELLSRRNKGEGVSTAQLLLFLERLQGGGAAASDAEPGSNPCTPDVEEANGRLRAASGIDARCSDGEPKPVKPPPQPSVRKPFPEHLKRVPDVIAVPEAERACPVCGGERECIGHDVTELAELKPAEVFVRVELREKLWCEPCEGEFVRAPVGDRVVSGGRFGPTLVAQLLVDKYEDGLPLHRQQQRFERLGLPVSVSTLADQVTWGTDLLVPVWRAAQDAVLASEVMHLDGTGMPVLVRDPKTHKKIGSGKRLGTLWGYIGGETALYLYCSTGHARGQTPEDIGPEQFLARRKGYTVADAASVFDKSFAREELIECGCNMHARRYFIKALEGGDERAALPIAGFKKLYDIEEQAKALDVDARLELRRKDSRPVYDSLLHWCSVYQREERPSSPLAKAVSYVLNHELALTRFLEAGCVPIDNGAAERLHVRVALTRKNHLFVGSDAGGRRAAIAYTILSSCRIAGVNPVEYLTDVLPRLARGVRLADAADLLPAAWRDRRAIERLRAATQDAPPEAPKADASQLDTS
ncbi:MAG: IS66 family transposase [Pseudonocardiaceae bacterium]